MKTSAAEDTTKLTKGDREWRRVVLSAEVGEDGACPACGAEASECPCPGPTQDGWEYIERGGVLYGRRSSR
jgi:hypothetical protein